MWHFKQQTAEIQKQQILINLMLRKKKNQKHFGICYFAIRAKRISSNDSKTYPRISTITFKTVVYKWNATNIRSIVRSGKIRKMSNLIEFCIENNHAWVTFLASRRNAE